MITFTSDSLSVTCFEVICQLVKLSNVLFDPNVDSDGRSQLLKRYLIYHKIISSEQLAKQGFDYNLLEKSNPRESVDLVNLIGK